MHIKQTSHLKRLLLALLLTGLASSAYGWEQDWDLDAEMDVLEQPVRREIITPLGDGRHDGRQRGTPVWPLYKQQPAAAQGDFRSLPPSGEGIPADIPGLPGSGGGSNPGSGVPVPPADKPNVPGDGPADPNQPDGPQITPPDMGGPDIPLPPINLPPINGGLI
jgi:hypothetical protein